LLVIVLLPLDWKTAIPYLFEVAVLPVTVSLLDAEIETPVPPLESTTLPVTVMSLVHSMEIPVPVFELAVLVVMTAPSQEVTNIPK